MNQILNQLVIRLTIEDDWEVLKKSVSNLF